ncbi:MAG: 2-hydroxychromene-2-carboxylate isomerase [Sphingopyxis sp.]|nr:2-hydroxychromene-2-carboxylate isomerase [Sphingopyxis sp.]
MTKSFEFLFDVGGANAYLVHRIMPDFCAATGATANYVPILLGGVFKATGNRAPMIRYADSPAKLAYEQLEFRRFIAAHSIDFKMSPYFPLNSLIAMRTLTGAHGTADFMPALDAIMQAFWVDGAKADEGDVLIDALNRAGLDGAALVARAGDDDVKAQLAANTQSAINRGVFGVPTFFVGDEMFWGKERLGQLEQALAGA